MNLRILFLYLCVGGLIAGVVDRYWVNKCDRHVPDAAIAMVGVLWPVFIVAGITTKSTTAGADCPAPSVLSQQEKI